MDGKGIGTTSPVGALHVVGQCVAEGTKIKRRRRRKTIDDGEMEDGNLKMEDGSLKDKNLSSTIYPQNTTFNHLPSIVGDYIYEDIPVEDILPDDEVLSLNDKTGEWEWHKVEKTMDMGIQEVYELETESGKSIQTTAEHPYLTQKGWKKVSQLKKGVRIATYHNNPKLMLAFVDETGIARNDNIQKEQGAGMLILSGEKMDIFDFNQKLRQVLISALDILHKGEGEMEFKFNTVTKTVCLCT